MRFGGVLFRCGARVVFSTETTKNVNSMDIKTSDLL